MAASSSPPEAQADPAEFWMSDPAALRRELGVPLEGWTASEAARMRASAGPNRIVTRERHSAARLLAGQFLAPIEVILILATVLAGLLGDWLDAAIILTILLLAGLLGFVQEWQAGRAMEALLSTVALTCNVRRDGAVRAVTLEEVVPGDVVVVSAGDVIPADCLVVDGNALAIDESAFTGETFPVSKQPAAAAPSTRSSAAFFGTHVVSGSGTLLVARTGASTQFAAIASALSRRRTPTGFERGMTRFGLMLTRVMLVLVVVIFAVNLLLQRPPLEAALFSLALAVGLTPQLLPAIVALGLARGAHAMARERVIVRKLDAIEDFGSMTVLCSDKTGTMTEGRIRFGEAIAPFGTDRARLELLAALNAGLQRGWTNPVDDAILAAHPLPPDAVGFGEVPYDFHRKRLSVVTRTTDGGGRVLITKGALESVVAVCTHAATGRGPVPLAEVQDELQRTFAALSDQGFRVLAIATRSVAEDCRPTPADEAGMLLEGLITLADPVKADAAEVVSRLAAAGVSVRIVTGDNRLVSAHVAAQVGLDATALRTGADIDRLSDAALAHAVDVTHVFCDMNPVQKERVVRAFRRAGQVVGYLGDGINDSPPLRAADLGITVEGAVPVAKQAASIVLLDKDLGVLLDGIRQGRRTFENTMKYIYVNTSASFGNMLSMAIAAPFLPFLPLLASQILVVNLLSDLPAMTLSRDAVDESRISRPQQWDLRLIRTFMIVFGALSSVFDLVTFVLLRAVFQAEAPEFRSAWLLGSVLTEVGVLFILRTRAAAVRSRPGTGLVVSSVAVAVIAIALPFSPAAPLLSLVAVPVSLLAVIAVIVVVYLATNEGVKRVFWRRFDLDAPRTKKGPPLADSARRGPF